MVVASPFLPFACGLPGVRKAGREDLVGRAAVQGPSDMSSFWAAAAGAVGHR